MTIQAGLAYIHKLWSSPSYEPEEKKPNRSSEWKVSLGDDATESGIAEVLKDASFKYNIDLNFRPPNSSHFLEVGQNRGITVKSDTTKPHVSEIKREIIVLFRAIKPDGTISQLGLAHLATRVDELKNVLNNMLNESGTTVEVYIAGGTSSSNKLYQSVRQYIESVQKVHRHRVSLQDDYYQATDLRAWLPKGSHPKKELCVREAGFDLNNEPFMILDHTAYAASR